MQEEFERALLFDDFKDWKRKQRLLQALETLREQHELADEKVHVANQIKSLEDELGLLDS
ncbi:hypothetical protein C1N87_26600 (plasmid) [Priestia aryabhattai]